MILNSFLLFISLFSLPSEIEQFETASYYGTIGLIAESYEPFFDLEIGMYIFVFDDNVEVYRITEILEYQALSPNSELSNFMYSGEFITNYEAFMSIYGVPERLVFQTCIDKNGINIWGRLFVIAERIL